MADITQASLDALSVTIASGTSLSPMVGLGNKLLVGIVMPAAWDAADITLQATPDGGTTWCELVLSDGAAGDAVATFQIHSPTASQFIALNPQQLRGVNGIKVRSGTSGAAVNQMADRVLTLLVRPIYF